MSYKQHFSRFLNGRDVIHFAAHSHHLWPDVSFEAHQRAWEDASRLADDKWDIIFGELLPRTRKRIARVLGLTNPDRIAFAPNTYEFVTRIVTSVADQRRGEVVRILTTDSEFHSFERQLKRWEESGLARATRISTQPFDDFADRFLQAASEPGIDVIFVSQVFFNSSFVFERFSELAKVTPDECVIVVDGYHGFMALPTDLGNCEDRIFYIAGGYKYAMSGEGACFMHCPDGWLPRPVQTGWFANFAEIADAQKHGVVGYGESGWRFWGSTFDPSGFYRMDAVLGWIEGLGISVADIHAHVRRLQARFLDAIEDGRLPQFKLLELTPSRAFDERGHFLNFRTPNAAEFHKRLREAGVMTDFRGENLRLGFGLYQDASDVDELCARIAKGLFKIT